MYIYIYIYMVLQQIYGFPSSSIFSLKLLKSNPAEQ